MMIKNNFSPTRKYIELDLLQVSKKAGDVCGDYALSERKQEHSVFILCDGLGSGIKANISAIMCASRLSHLLNTDMSLYQACQNIVSSMHRARTEDTPFAAFAVAKVQSDGRFTVLSYEMPPPIILEKNHAYLPEQRFFTMGHEVVGESNGILKTGDTLVLVTDGVSQAGLGHGYSFGWKMEGLQAFINAQLSKGMKKENLPSAILEEVRNISGNTYGDDTSIMFLTCREARTLNVLTGPPSAKDLDTKFVEEFMEADGLKAICGSTTSDLVSRYTGRPVTLGTITTAYSQPPKYNIEGIDLVCEGVVTLNQVYNIIGEDPEGFEDISCVQELYSMMIGSDIIRFLVGDAVNPANKTMTFKQMGLTPRRQIVKLIAEKLRDKGKLVVIKNY